MTSPFSIYGRFSQWGAVLHRLCLLELHKTPDIKLIMLKESTMTVFTVNLLKACLKAWKTNLSLWPPNAAGLWWYKWCNPSSKQPPPSIHDQAQLWSESTGAINLGLVTSLYPNNKQNKHFTAWWRWRGPDVNLAVAPQLSSCCTPPSPEIKHSNTRWSKWN